MAIIEPEGLFGGDRLRRCSNLAQLHWPRFFLASDGFGRLELNYARIIGRAYPTFNPPPAAEEINGFIQEYSRNFLLFVYEFRGQHWGQWDTRPEFLPRYKTASDRRSPIPDEKQLQEWKQSYVIECKSFPKCFRNFSTRGETFRSGVGVGVGVEKGLVVVKTACLAVAENPITTTTIRESFPNTDDAMIGQIIVAAQQAFAAICPAGSPALTDTQIAECVKAAYFKKQYNASPYRQGVANVVKSRFTPKPTVKSAGMLLAEQDYQKSLKYQKQLEEYEKQHANDPGKH